MTDKSLSTFAITATIQSLTKCLIDAPFERIKLLLQLQPGIPQLYPNNRYEGIFDCIIRVYREQGFLSYWRGVTPEILLNIIKRLWMFSLNDYFRVNIAKHNNGFVKNIFAGTLSGMTSLIITYPLNCLRTKLAVDVGRSLNDREYKGMNDCAIKIWKTDGIRGFFRGIWLTFPGILIYRGMYFGLYNTLKTSSISTRDLFVNFAIAQFITTFSSLTVYPIDTVRRRMIMQTGKFRDLMNISTDAQRQEEKFKNSFDCAYKILRKEGFKSFYGGFWFNFIKGIGGALLLVGYDLIGEYR